MDTVGRPVIDRHGRTHETIDLATIDIATIDLETIDLLMTAIATIDRDRPGRPTQGRHVTQGHVMPARHVTQGRHVTPARHGTAVRRPMTGRGGHPRPVIARGKTARLGRDRTDRRPVHLEAIVRPARARHIHATDIRTETTPLLAGDTLIVGRPRAETDTAIADRRTARTDTPIAGRRVPAPCRHRDHRPCRHPTRSARTRN